MVDRRGVIGRWIDEDCCPIICTLATAEVERLCAKNNLLFHELLSAFGTVDNVNGTIRGINHPLSFADFRVRFERGTEIAPKSIVQANEALYASLKGHSMDIPTSLDSFAIKDVALPLASTMEHCIFRSTTFAEHNTLDAPSLLLIAVSSTDFEPLQCLQELHTAHKPRAFRSGMYDPDLPCVFVLVHDSCETGAPDPIPIFRQIQTRFSPPFSRLLMINSMPPESPNSHQPDLWSPHLNALFFPREVPEEALVASPSHAEAKMSSGEPSATAVRGVLLSPEDLMTLRDFVADLCRAHVLPLLERRMLTLNNTVTSARKGVRNAIKSWWRKPREETERVGEVLYSYDRIESQIRLLADTLFLCKDYEGALGMYKLVRDDYKADKAYLHYAHTNLMIAVCNFVLDATGRLRDIQSSVESTMNSLMKPQDAARSPAAGNVHPDGHQIAFMTLMATELISASVFGARASHSEAAVMNLHGARCAPPLASAVLTEKAGWHFLRVGQSRRFAFHEVLAARTYQLAGRDAEQYAVRCYSVAMLEYETGQWGNIKVLSSFEPRFY